MRVLDIKRLVAWLLVVGALNWGIVGLTGGDPLGDLLGGLANIVYIVVGLAGAYKAYLLVTGGKK